MGRKFERISAGGVRDEAEIRGHRRTYIGAMPGVIVRALRDAGSENPVFMIDEIDKMGSDYRGDPASAMLEVLDPEQNATFRDHYLDVPYDLSRVMFITTANTLDTIPGPLRDRMEIIPLAGYTEEEKLQIAKRYLVPRQIERNGLKRSQIAFSDAGLKAIIEEYTREAGVRNLEREIGSVCRKVARQVAEGTLRAQGDRDRAEGARAARPPALPGRRQAPHDASPAWRPGLAWTPVGGDVLFVEASAMPGTGKLTITGQLGDVMKESAQAALSYVRSHADGLPEDFFKTHDIHVHVPAGAIPKDGPSAGITMATALMSLVTDRRVRDDTAMTGRADAERARAADRRPEGEGAGRPARRGQARARARAATSPTSRTSPSTCATAWSSSGSARSPRSSTPRSTGADPGYARPQGPELDSERGWYGFSQEEGRQGPEGGREGAVQPVRPAGRRRRGPALGTSCRPTSPAVTRSAG